VIAALLPMAFVSGLMGPYMSPIPINSQPGHGAVAGHRLHGHALAGAQADEAGHGACGADGDASRPRPRAGEACSACSTRCCARCWTARASAGCCWPASAALLLSVGLALVQWVVLKMLPFDNKSEFQLVVDMPAGTPLEDTAATLQETGRLPGQQPEVRDLQGYAGTASPITFNGLVRQYYLRADAEQGDLQVNLVDKQHRSEQSHAIAQRLRPALEPSPRATAPS
jgi:multidrug efflux pump subunit AcrB